MRTLCLALLSVLSASPALARDREPRVRVFAEPDVVSLTTRKTPDGGRLRAILVESQRDVSVVVEALSARGVIVRQVEIDTIETERRTLRMRDLAGVSDLDLGPRGLEFRIELERRGPLTCFVPLERDGMPASRTALCGDRNDGPGRPDQDHDHDHGHGHDHGGPGGPPGPVQPPPPQWARTPEVIRACGNELSGQANEVACLDKVDRFRMNPVAAITKCAYETSGDVNALACLDAVVDYVEDPSPLITSCAYETSGDANMLRCMAEARRTGYAARDLPPIVAACAYATSGDDNALRCIAATAGVRGGAGQVVQLIKACDESMSGDEAAIACIGRR